MEAHDRKNFFRRFVLDWCPPIPPHFQCHSSGATYYYYNYCNLVIVFQSCMATDCDVFRSAGSAVAAAWNSVGGDHSVRYNCRSRTKSRSPDGASRHRFRQRQRCCRLVATCCCVTSRVSGQSSLNVPNSVCEYVSDLLVWRSRNGVQSHQQS